MPGMRVGARLLGVERAIVEDAVPEEASGSLVVSVRLRRRDRNRCGLCRRRCPGYDAGDGRRRWRALDLGTTKAYLEVEAPGPLPRSRRRRRRGHVGPPRRGAHPGLRRLGLSAWLAAHAHRTIPYGRFRTPERHPPSPTNPLPGGAVKKAA